MDSDHPNRSDVFVPTVITARCPLCVHDIHNAFIYICITETVDFTSGFSFSQITHVLLSVSSTKRVVYCYFGALYLVSGM